ncbi:MAG: SGNH/GDSL hydrolase family protein [Clostridia bacterium]|nr:SGNH/GDSL hydrolase family protein [Clostridia bacterium]
MRALNYEEIRSAAFGAVCVRQESDGIHFYRFHQNQMEHYEQNREDFFRKSKATAGVRLSFMSDTTSLKIDYTLIQGSSRKFAHFDVCENGVLVGHFGVEEEGDSKQSGEVLLSAGEKLVEIYFPWSAGAIIASIALSEGATFEPAKRQKTMLSYGDSITQGYDASYPSQAYAAKLAALLDADSINRGIGGEIFRPALLLEKEDFEPDYITVAYGTNDWSCRTMESFAENCRSFYATLSEQYPKSKIYAITPIWRKDGEEERPIGVPHGAMESVIEELVADLPNVRVIGGYPLTPHLSAFFSDLYLHPNDLGFLHYAHALCEEIKNEG